MRSMFEEKKRGRGRPKGAKNKSKIKEISISGEVTSAEVSFTYSDLTKWIENILGYPIKLPIKCIKIDDKNKRIIVIYAKKE